MKGSYTSDKTIQFVIYNHRSRNWSVSKISMSRSFPTTSVTGNWAVNLLKLHLCFRLLIAVAIVASFIKISAATRAFVSQQATMPSMFHYSTESICSRLRRMNFQMFVRYRPCDKSRKLSRTAEFTNDTKNKRVFFFISVTENCKFSVPSLLQRMSDMNVHEYLQSDNYVVHLSSLCIRWTCYDKETFHHPSILA